MRETVRYTYSAPKGTAPGAVFAHARTPEGHDAAVGALTFHPPMAWVDVDEEAGTMISTAQARITEAAVAKPLQRTGVGSEMYRVAERELGAPIGHSGTLSPAGYAFAKSVGGHIPPSVNGPTTPEREPLWSSMVVSAALKDHRNRRPVPGAPKPSLGPQFQHEPEGEQLELPF
ncbi:MAG: hypothetical protein EBR40_10385 [Proteobacteria bacterium]|nr:hypothetical protein [Pseudomonadota bacterium]